MKKKRLQERKENKNILLTGGHAVTTAIAVVEEIKKRGGWDIYWVGVKYAFEGSKTSSIEARVFSDVEYGVKFVPITTGRIQRRFTFWTIPSLLKIPVGFVQSMYLLSIKRPDIVLSFGGFASYPVVVAAWVLRIPIMLHEQTLAAGRANIKSSKFATKIALARTESKKYFPNEKCIVIGNPVSNKMFQVNKKDDLSGVPTIFITGGSRGAQVINEAIESVLVDLLAKYKIVHHTGQLDFNKFKNIQESLPERLRRNYEVMDFIWPDKMSKYYEKADIVISRAGANTVSEILVTKRPSILIPIPWTYLNEQQKNAEYAGKFGLATIINQNDLSPSLLKKTVGNTLANWSRIVSKVRSKSSPDKNASSRLVDVIEKIVE